MADTSHIEKMGRELKCPICLSLLNYAVSLSCNHLFCNCCIEKSMKSASNCPVCKIPFRRREIHPAPHMDNLVSIYKSMEVASGVNIFVTQTAPLTQIPGYENNPDDDKIFEIQENSKTCIGTSAWKNQKRCIRKGSRRSAQANNKFNSINPSFPAKKRVHVPQGPPSETPLRSEKLANETADSTKKEPETSFLIKDKPVFKEIRKPLFTPFFWLRDEEDAEKTTQQTDEDHIMETPPNAPCFSDIKDSDDEIPSEMPPDSKICVPYRDVDFLDSEMFEWTQRACSPELHSSPVRMQAEDSTECGGQAKKGSVSHVATTIMESKVEDRGNRSSGTDREDLSLLCSASSFPRDKIVNKRTRMSRKRIKKAVENKQNKRIKTTKIEAPKADKESERMPGDRMQEEKFDNNDTISSLTKKTSNRIKNVCFDDNVTEAARNISTASCGTDPLSEGNKEIVVDLPVLSDDKKQKRGNNLKKIGKISKNMSPIEKHSFNSEAKKLKAAKESMTVNQYEVSPSKTLSSDKEEVYDMGRVLRKCEGNYGREKKNLKMVRFSEGNKSKDNVAYDSQYQNINGKVAAIDQVNPNRINNGNSSEVQAICQLSERSPNKIFCAFCQSAEESEASGVMIHYLKGKSIAGDEIRGPNVIHSHKNCTEWAPNVFFEDDNVINLEAELARSRKIKCRLCGMKGAALGCFQKSCRKSFHVPCAKMTPKFRWDYDHFVSLCPLHASCKLPCEAHGSQSNQKRKTAPKGDSRIRQPQVVKDGIKEHLQWKSHKKAKNLFLCCSGLTDIEKDIVSQFERLSRFTVLKQWDPSVTHVVASTDENGACKRTLKFLMGILEGKWIVNIEWIKACIKSMEFVDEQHYEIKVDIHGIRDGPNLGRLRLLEKKPKLFSGCKFYFVGKFLLSYKRYLHDLVIAAGGTALNRKPVLEDQEIVSSKCPTSTTFVVYSLEQPEKCGASKRNSILNCTRLDAETLASSTRAVAVSNSWILSSIASCKLQNLAG